jgi:hypothetical protein
LLRAKSAAKTATAPHAFKSAVRASIDVHNGRKGRTRDTAMALAGSLAASAPTGTAQRVNP